jgi:ABC-type sugar transport system permease subunit
MSSTVADVRQSRGATVKSGRRRAKGIISLYLAPALLIYVALYIYPALDAFRASLYEWTGFDRSTARYVGFQNFVSLARDPTASTALKNNVYIVIFGGIVMFTLALLFAVALSRSEGHSFWGEVARVGVFAPYVISSIAVALFWVFVYNPRWGLLNSTLRGIGLDNLALPWLGLKQTALPAVTFVMIWQGVGFYMTLLMAGIQGIPVSLNDAAKIDGAGGWQLFRYITLPLLRDVLTIAILYWIIGSFQVFAVIFAMTRGGPANFTQVITTYQYQLIAPYQAAGFRMGYGTALSVVLFVVVAIVSIIYLRLTTREAIEY